MAKRIVLADDDPNLLHLLKMRLRSKGYDVHAVSDGTQALAAVLETKPDLIMLDELMPGLTGFQVATKIKECGGDIAQIPVIIVSAKHSMKYLFDELGIFAFIPKPFDPDELLRTVAESLGEKPDGPAAPETSGDPDGQKDEAAPEAPAQEEEGVPEGGVSAAGQAEGRDPTEAEVGDGVVRGKQKEHENPPPAAESDIPIGETKEEKKPKIKNEAKMKRAGADLGFYNTDFVAQRELPDTRQEIEEIKGSSNLILLACESTTLGRKICSFLTKLGYEVAMAAFNDEAKLKLKKKKPCFIISEILEGAHRLDTNQFYTDMKASEETKHIPFFGIVYMSVRFEDFTKLPMDRCIYYEEFDLSDLRVRLQKVLEAFPAES